jgi:hypothetical protein
MNWVNERDLGWFLTFVLTLLLVVLGVLLAVVTCAALVWCVTLEDSERLDQYISAIAQFGVLLVYYKIFYDEAGTFKPTWLDWFG